MVRRTNNIIYNGQKDKQYNIQWSEGQTIKYTMVRRTNNIKYNGQKDKQYNIQWSEGQKYNIQWSEGQKYNIQWSEVQTIINKILQSNTNTTENP